MANGPATTITKCTVDAVTGTMDLGYQVTYDLGNGTSEVQSFETTIPGYQVTWFLALVQLLVLPGQWANPAGPAPTDADVGRLWAECMAIAQSPAPAAAPPIVFTPPPISVV